MPALQESLRAVASGMGVVWTARDSSACKIAEVQRGVMVCLWRHLHLGWACSGRPGTPAPAKLQRCSNGS
eukprot:1161782-Pelagomonas_calceolata.AAC.16